MKSLFVEKAVEIELEDFLINYEPTELLEDIFEYLENNWRFKKNAREWLLNNMNRLEDVRESSI